MLHFLQPWEDWLSTDPTRLLEKMKAYESKYKGQLRGKIVLVDPPRELTPPTEPPVQTVSRRRTY